MTEIAPPSEQAAEILDFAEFSPSKATRKAKQTGKTAVGSNIVTEDGAAQRFVEMYADKLRYCHTTGAWFEWDGISWKQDTKGLAFYWARKLARELAVTQPDKVRYMASKTSFASGVDRFARTDPALAVTAEVWDKDTFLFGTPNGTVDLRTGKLRPSDPKEGITRLSVVSPAETADCPQWLAFLDQITCGDAELIRFLQQWCGYSLTGDTTEQTLVFGCGPGGNGKGVFVNTVSGIFGDYAVTAAMDTFTESKFTKHSTELAMLRGARMVTASETEEGRPWAESRIKQLTGGDKITARFMHKDNFTFIPHFKLTIIGNHHPVLRTVDDAMRRRFRIVPFMHKPAKPDPHLEAKLKAEWPQILRWMIDGCLDWQKNRLIKPRAIAETTETYFADQDVFGSWLEEECDADPGNASKWESAARLYAEWAMFAQNAGETPGTAKTFAAEMGRRGFARHRARSAGKIVRAFRGIRLAPKGSEAL
jgi:putative DNA primase/helicase